MTFFSHPRTKRHITIAVLLVWLFALSAGWANACLLQQRTTHIHGSLYGAAADAHGPGVWAGHAGATPAHDENAGSLTAPCLKVCADGSQSPVRAPITLDLTDISLAPPLACAWATRTASAWTVISATEATPGSAGTPLRIRYSKLVL